MTWGFGAHRRAEEFDELVGRAPTGGTHGASSSRDAELLELVGALRSVPEAQPRPEFVSDLRGRLMAEAETALVPTDVSRLQLPARRTKRERRIAAVVGGLAIVGASTSVAVASQSALPGESLYPIKRVLESAHTGISVSEASKGSTELANAASRLDEVTALTRDPDLGDDQRIARTLGSFTDQATSGADLLISDYAESGREGSISDLRDFASSSMDQLAALEPAIPYVARDELIAAASTVAQIDAEAAQQCPTCGGDPIDVIPPSLVSAEHIELPVVPPATSGQRPAHQAQHGATPQPGDTPTAPAAEDPALPDVDGAVPPGSVSEPDPVTPSRSPSPLQDLTDGLTDVLTGKGAGTGSGGSGGSGPGSGGGGTTPSPTPLNQVVDGVNGILHDVVDPITGQLLPGVTPQP
jgi:hypothetical protein